MRLLGFALLAGLSAAASAGTIVRWDFEGDVTTPSVGSGTASLVGGSTASFATGFGGGRGWNTTSYPAQGTNDRKAGAEFRVDLSGYRSIVVSWDHRHSNTSANTVSFQYTLDGLNWTEAATFVADAGDTWFSRSVDLGAIPFGTRDFGFRILAAFADSSGYKASKSGSSYATTGTWRFDNVTVTAEPVPEPATLAAMGTGLAALGAARRRRR